MLLLLLLLLVLQLASLLPLPLNHSRSIVCGCRGVWARRCSCTHSGTNTPITSIPILILVHIVRPEQVRRWFENGAGASVCASGGQVSVGSAAEGCRRASEGVEKAGGLGVCGWRHAWRGDDTTCAAASNLPLLPRLPTSQPATARSCLPSCLRLVCRCETGGGDSPAPGGVAGEVCRSGGSGAIGRVSEGVRGVSGRRQALGWVLEGAPGDEGRDRAEAAAGHGPREAAGAVARARGVGGRCNVRVRPTTNGHGPSAASARVVQAGGAGCDAMRRRRASKIDPSHGRRRHMRRHVDMLASSFGRRSGGRQWPPVRGCLLIPHRTTVVT